MRKWRAARRNGGSFEFVEVGWESTVIVGLTSLVEDAFSLIIFPGKATLSTCSKSIIASKRSPEYCRRDNEFVFSHSAKSDIAEERKVVGMVRDRTILKRDGTNKST
jgi:hypothetical protein